MHFWIDKRSQCGYSGRHRVPSSLSAGVGIGVGRSRGRVCAAGRKGMAAPVHRFAPVDCAPRRPRPMRHYGEIFEFLEKVEQSANDALSVITNTTPQSIPKPPPMPPVHTSRRQNQDPSVYVEIPPGPPQPTIASLAAARSVTPDTLLRTAALGLHHSPMMAPHLKFGMLVSFALATVFLTGAKYYFDRQVMRAGSNNGYASSGEAGVVCATVACVCGVGCALSLCRARTAPPPAPPDRVSSTARRRPASPSPARPLVAGPVQREVQEPEDISLIPLTRDEGAVGGEAVGGASESPPPYHIAVLLPPPSPPPPAYSALS